MLDGIDRASLPRDCSAILKLYPDGISKCRYGCLGGGSCEAACHLAAIKVGSGGPPAVDNDKRITPVGKVIRALRVDELPQLINILKGDMSIVGPRPERIEHVEKYSEEIPEFVCRYKVKGGLTGYAQVFGKYNTSAYNKLKMDLIYIQNYSLALDFKLILMTVKILFKKESTEGFKENGKKVDK